MLQGAEVSFGIPGDNADQLRLAGPRVEETALRTSSLSSLPGPTSW